MDVSSLLPSLKVESPALSSEQCAQLQKLLQVDLATALAQVAAGLRSASDVPQGARPSSVNLGSLPAPEGERGYLEDRLGALVADFVATTTNDEGHDVGSALARTCVSTSPGTFLSLTVVRDLLATPPPDHDPNLPLTIAIRPPSGDALTLEVFPLASPVLPSGDVQVGLATAVNWAKQIVAWTVCPPQHHQYVRRDSKGVADWMAVSRSDNLNALVFRKPRIFGIWFDMFYFDMPEFIDVLGGRYARFTWYFD